MRNQLLLAVQLEHLLRRYAIYILIIRILLISAQLYSRTIPAYTTTPPPTKTSPPIKTPTYSSTHGRRGTRSTAAPLALSPITSTLGTTITATTSASAGSVWVYLVIAISTRINIVYKRVTNMVKDI